MSEPVDLDELEARLDEADRRGGMLLSRGEQRALIAELRAHRAAEAERKASVAREVAFALDLATERLRAHQPADMLVSSLRAIRETRDALVESGHCAAPRAAVPSGVAEALEALYVMAEHPVAGIAARREAYKTIRSATVLRQKVELDPALAELATAVRAQAWEQGYNRGWIVGSEVARGADARTLDTENPYRKDPR